MLMCVDRTSLRWMDRIWWVLVNIVVGDGGYVHCGHLTCSMLVLIVRTALYCLDRPCARPWLRIRCVWTEDIFLIWSFLDRRWGKRKGLLVWSGRHGQFMGQNGNMGTFQCWCVRCANMRVCGLQFTFETISDMSWIAALLIVYVIPFIIHSFSRLLQIDWTIYKLKLAGVWIGAALADRSCVCNVHTEELISSWMTSWIHREFKKLE